MSEHWGRNKEACPQMLEVQNWDLPFDRHVQKCCFFRYAMSVRQLWGDTFIFQFYRCPLLQWWCWQTLPKKFHFCSHFLIRIVHDLRILYWVPGWFQSCKNVQTVRTSRCYFFWPVLIFGKSTRKTGENTRKQAKNRRFFGANFFVGKIGRC